ncbi:retrovirus-related pol polyprotein from transposon TNT 1-94 [Tanacetum coccineum]
MKDNFETSMIGEMKFFLGLRVHQSPQRIFICQSQYTMDLLRKHGMEKCDTVTTPMATAKIDADLQGTLTDQTKYRSMIGGLMYLTASRQDCLCGNVCALVHLDEDATARLWISVEQDSDEHVEKGTIELYFVGTNYQLADLFTKALLREMFEYLVHKIGMRCMTPTELERLAKHWEMQQLCCATKYSMSPECKIFRQILLDHPLSYALTATVDVPAVYLQQFGNTVRKVPDTKDTIIFKLDS